MIVFKITYDTSVVADFAPTFNNGWGYDYTTKTSTSGTLKTVTYESDTAFTSISIPNNNRNCVKSIYVDASGVTNLGSTFTSCQTMTDFTMVNATPKLTNLYQITYDCTILTNITYQDCDLSSVTNIQNVFNGGPKDAVTNATFKNVKFNNTTKSMISLLCKATAMVVEDCDFSSVTSFYTLFAGCIGLKGTLDFSMYDLTNVYEVNSMFKGCTNLTKIIMPKGTFDKITTCEGMFQDCTSLVEVDLSGFHIPNAQKISYMFSGCVLIEEIDCSGLGVLNPTNINHMFVSCQKLKRVNLSGIKVPKRISFSHMFYDSTVIEWIDISNVLAQASDVSNFWKSGAVVNNIGMLYCSASAINYFTNTMVSSGRTCNIYYHDAKLEDLTVDSRFNYIYCEEYHGDVVSTPDDLELYCNYYYDRNTKTSTPCYQDTLDLTTGTITRKNIKARLNNCIAKYGTVEGALVTVNGGDMVCVKYNHMNTSTGTFPVQVDGEVTGLSVTGIALNTSQGGYDGAWFTTSDIEHAYTNPNTIYMFFNPSRFDGIDYTDSETIKNWLIEQDFTLIIKIQNASVYTEQLPTSINTLKSYRNGSIQTSSQQLVPTLKTTLPISNKFTTTNLTSGSTYNVYFDGTATKLDAGGTIITNPVSPCEVECGGTTLTIEGTDIQNVRVLETTVKNEVGSVNGTTDVELNRVTSKCELYNYFDEYKQNTNYYCTSIRDDNKITITGSSTLNYAGYVHSSGLSKGTYKFHCKVRVSQIGDKYRVLFHYNPNKATNDEGGFAWAETTSTQLIEEINYVGYFSSANSALFYSYYNGQEIEYYDISLIKLSDEDITGTDTSAINYSQITSKLEQPIKLRSLGTTYDSYNPVTGELTKRIGVSETDGSYSVLNSPIVENIGMGMPITNLITNTFPITGFTNFSGNFKPNTTYTVFLDIGAVNGETASGFVNNSGAGQWGSSQYSYAVGKQVFTTTTDSTTGGFVYRLRGNPTINSAMIIEGDITNYDLEYFMGTKQLQVPPHLYTNGQVKVYSESDVYPTTILNGQSTNNYEINELNTSNNYTIRYDGACESINLTKKSNTQGTNRIVKAGATSGNLTFVNDSGDIDNVLLVQNDVREQEINHFNGLQTVEISQLFVSNKQNLFEQYMKNDFEFLNNVAWGAQAYGSLHNGVFKCGNLSAGSNLQWAWNLIKPHVDNVYGSRLKEDNPIVLANKVYNISFNISIVDHHTVNGNHNYNIRAFDFDGNEVSVQKATGGQAFLSTWSNGVTNPTTTNFINLDVIFSKDVYCFVLHADYGGLWVFDCTITDFTICEPENAKPDVPLVYEYIDLPQPVQLNSLLDGTHDTYNPITGEYVQNVGYLKASDATIEYRSNTTTHIFAIKNNTITNPPILTDGWKTYLESNVLPRVYNEATFGITQNNLYWYLGMNIPKIMYPFKEDALQWVLNNVIILYKVSTPTITQLTPITIPTFEGGIVQLITTDGKVFPMIEYSMPTLNRYDTSSWETGAVYTQRNMTEAYFNESTTPMIPTETMTLTTDHISSGSIILNDNGNGLIVLKGNYTGRDIPYFTGMRSVESIEVEVTPSPDQPLFGKGGRK